ncbi:GNAT family N-acetyltransferase [Flavobacterium sp. MAH-1]|uniref:GNAT family N-acetyltransferase n=1 Tax=Flavobacterium agri TaxID=2743471 RepID=A0A7Y8Y0Z0_9FLAO|nr:bifunctional helix-turn-helix transcriptional regulator/GNAT family N-acetyltransferase [Flavobacterium agri]NUY80442.1 GNAT family N-acetyltransferase [Flavobacterium agri]NYA70467.1 GNAT family N-acetyltransferase [Flavobacterium agri]
MDIFQKTGKVAIGSRLRLLTAKVTEDASKIYEMYHVDFSPKWFPVFFVLSEDGEKTITEIAEQIRHSQPSVTKIIKEMSGAGLVKGNQKSDDKRRNVVGLSKKGTQLAETLRIQTKDVELAVEGLMAESTNNLWEAIAEWEFLLQKKSLFKRVQEQKKLRESANVEIVEYEPKYKTAFKQLNEEWISNYFEIEETDSKALDNPEKSILEKGGEIFVALYENEPLGVCALIKMDDPDYDFELAKMAVSPKAQGKSIGLKLGQAVIEEARKQGAKKIYLESNTILTPAINLYYKLGFEKIVGRATPYKRCNIQMELRLK